MFIQGHGLSCLLVVMSTTKVVTCVNAINGVCVKRKKGTAGLKWIKVLESIGLGLMDLDAHLYELACYPCKFMPSLYLNSFNAGILPSKELATCS